MKTKTTSDKIKGVISDLAEFKTNILEKRILGNHSNNNIGELYEKVHLSYSPVFVLSTGRCGTALLDKILNSHDKVKAFHNPYPELGFHSNLAYDAWVANKSLDKLVVDSARYELIRDNYILGKQYIETNNRITFFAFQLAQLFPKAKFIHLVRNPNSFIESGLNRNWFQSGKLTEESRLIKPVDGWRNENQAEKIWWLWNETNRFIHEFKEATPASRVLTVKAEDLFSKAETTKSVFSFIGHESISDQQIEKLIKTKTNKSKKITKKPIGISEDQLNSETLNIYYPDLNKNN